MKPPTKSEKLEFRCHPAEKEALFRVSSDRWHRMPVSELIRQFIFDNEKIVILEEGAVLAEAYQKLHRKLFSYYKYHNVPDEDAETIQADLLNTLEQLMKLNRTLMEHQYSGHAHYVGIGKPYDPKEPKSEKIEMRITPDEKKLLETAADAAELTVSDYVRTMLFCPEKVIILAQSQMLAESFFTAYKYLSDFCQFGYLSEEMTLRLENCLHSNLSKLDSVTDKLTDIRI